MALTIKAGTRLFSDVCPAELIAVKAPSDEISITIGGVPPRLDNEAPATSATVVDGHGEGVLMGKRYVDDADTIELLCTKQGEGVPAVDGEILHIKDAKPLPASD